jgi:hypothetical protein
LDFEELVAQLGGTLLFGLGDEGVEGWIGFAPVIDGGAVDAGGASGGRDRDARSKGRDDLRLNRRERRDWSELVRHKNSDLSVAWGTAAFDVSY